MTAADGAWQGCEPGQSACPWRASDRVRLLREVVVLGANSSSHLLSVPEATAQMG